MAGLLMTITDAGLDALVDAEGGGSDDIVIDALGLTNQIFAQAPTLTALPGQFKQLAAISGEAVSDNIVHLTAYDQSADMYDVTGFGLFLDDGTLFAVYSSDADPVLSKAELAFALFSQDISFDNSNAANITFGTSIFSYPPASKTKKGVAELADDGEADTGSDDLRIMTPKMVKRRIDAIPSASEAARGLAEIATNGEADAGVDDERIMTPAKVKRRIDAALPVGIISLWSGEIVSIPAGWALCDGANGTPDLRDRFIVGAGTDFNVGDTGGSDTHDHGGSVQDHTLTTAEIPEHRHFVAVPGVFDATLTSSNSIAKETAAGGDTEYILRGDNAEPSIGRTSATGSGDPHDHGLTINDATTLPPYYTLAYIMKI